MKNNWRLLGAGAALIVLLTVVVYIPAMRGGFIWDDTLITDNPMIKARDGLYRLWFASKPVDIWPLTSSACWLEWQLWGNSPTGYHVVNVLLHAVNAILVWMILRRLRIPGAWLAGLVFAVHPVNVATAAWISEQKNTLSMLFYALAILLYLRFDEEGRSPRTHVRGWRWPRSERGWYGLSLAAFVLALLSKTAVVMLPVVLLGCIWWMHGRVRRKDLLCTIVFFVFSLVWGLATIWFQQDTPTEGYVVRAGVVASRLAAAGWAPWFYLYKALLPLNLNVIYPKWAVDASRWVSYVPGVILIGSLVVFWWKRRTWGRPLLFGLGYFVVTLFPVLGFFYQSFHLYSLVADHWQYHSIAGVIALVVATGEKIGRRAGKRGRSVELLASVAVLVVLGAATWRRACVYRGEETLWRDTLAKNPDAWVAHNNLGLLLAGEGKLQEAIWHGEQVAQIRPDDPKVHSNLGVALAQAGRVQEAIAQFEHSLRIKPDYAEVRNNLGLALSQVGKIQDAITQYEQAVEIRPDYAEAHYNLGLALERAGRSQDAIGHYEQALRIKPDYTEAQNALARLRAAQ